MSQIFKNIFAPLLEDGDTLKFYPEKKPILFEENVSSVPIESETYKRTRDTRGNVYARIGGIRSVEEHKKMMREASSGDIGEQLDEIQERMTKALDSNSSK